MGSGIVSAISGEDDGRFSGGGEKVTKEIILREISGVVEGEGAEERAEEVVWTGGGGIGEVKKGMVRKAPGGPGKGRWQGFGGRGEVGVEVGWIRGVCEGA